MAYVFIINRIFMRMKNSDKLRKICQIRNLLRVAKADGRFSDEEKAFIEEKAKRYKLSFRQLSKIEKPGAVENIFPKELGEKMQYLYELAELALLDKFLHESEIMICRTVAVKMGIIPEAVDQIIKDLKRNHFYLKVA